MPWLTDLIESLGAAIYVALFLYCVYKSGLLPLFAGVAAQQGLLEIGSVWMSVLAGGIVADELRFALARRYGIEWAARWPNFYRALEHTRGLMNRHGLTYLIVYRYVLGLRSIGALPVGLSDIKPLKFRWVSAASALTWTNVLVGLGYVLGQSAELALQGGFGLMGLVLLIAFAALAWRSVQRFNQNS